MNARSLALIAILLPFSALTLYAVTQVGYVGIFTSVMANAGTWQVLIDLVIVCLLACLWMLADARAQGRNAWPFVAITIAAGSFGPLLYLLTRELRGRAH